MKKLSFSIPEFFNSFAFLLWLVGSSLSYIKNGIELSLWLMTFAMAITAAVRVLPLLGIRWLHLKKLGCQGGQWLALSLQIVSWFVFAYALALRLGRKMTPFHTMIVIDTFLWALWVLIQIYSRHACHSGNSDDTL